jgi:hypothetical protein
VAVDAFLTLGEDFLKETCRFRRGTRRVVVVVVDEESELRRGVGCAVWNGLVVRSDGCIRQPIAAVRRVGAVHSILLECIVSFGGELLVEWVGVNR